MNIETKTSTLIPLTDREIAAMLNLFLLKRTAYSDAEKSLHAKLTTAMGEINEKEQA